jgi:hypothetical protein
MQMLLFAHAVSARRERSGGSVINGVWLSGGGVYIAPREAPGVASLYTDAPLPRDLARARGVQTAPASRSFKDWSEAQPKSPSLVLLPAIRESDGPASLAALGRDWADPLRAALDARASLEVSLVIAGRGRAWSFALRRRSRIARLRSRLAQPALSTLLAVARR